ncbi:hypothetical protein FZEAL_4373 [Fusarium zealandicum]|uniref:DUF6594 domain-containing protein n=1 Tax=Fusarium zealandicum TaxID=1053134 RepID=A0A8H4XLZ3_9HYPO|nr:hypothetical protein FZEAL_4373 [Fusarium zealandicum]
MQWVYEAFRLAIDKPSVPAPCSAATLATNTRTLGAFSNVLKDYRVAARVGKHHGDALPDTGAQKNLISPQLAEKAGLVPHKETQRMIQLPTGDQLLSPGTANVPFSFAGELESYVLECSILAGCSDDLVLSATLLHTTRTLAEFRQRIRERKTRFPTLKIFMSHIPAIERHAGQSDQNESLGFAALSSLMASDKDQELLIFRKFDELSARNLLYLQCELLVVEGDLERCDELVSKSGDTVLEQAAETWEIMVEQAKGGKPEAIAMMKLVDRPRTKMKEYHEALELQSRVAGLHRPERRALNVARNELHGGPMRPDDRWPNPVIGGKAKYYLDSEEDLISLRAPVETDPLSNILRAYWPGKEETSRDGLRRISRYEERSITIAVALINILVAIILLVGSITSLYYVASPAATLGMICAFTVLFAPSVGLMPNEKRAEIFAGSAAYAAVLVVFVSNGQLSGGGSSKQT